MVKIYGSPNCPNCVRAKALFEEKGLPFPYVNISGSMEELKEFLKLRDTEELFAPIKEQGLVGIPCFRLESGLLTHDVRQAMIDAYISAHRQEMIDDIVSLCRIDGIFGGRLNLVTGIHDLLACDWIKMHFSFPPRIL